MKSKMVLILLFFLFFFQKLFSRQIGEQKDSIEYFFVKAESPIISDSDSSFIFAVKALERSKDLGDSLLLAKSHHLMGRLLFFKGIYSESASNLLIAEDLLQNAEDYSLLIDNYNLRGRIAYKTQNLDSAVSMHQKSLDLSVKIKDEKRQAISLGLLGGIYEKKQEFQTALVHQWTALSIFGKLGIDDLSSEFNENLGSIYEDLGNFDSASFYFQKAFELNVKAGDSLNLISIINNLGDISRKNGQPKDGLLKYNLALDLSRKLNQPYEESSALRDIAKSYFDLKEFQMAYQYLDSSRTVHQEMFSKETATQLALMDELFQMKLKDRKIFELQQKKKFDEKIQLLFIVLILLLIGFSWLIINKKNIQSKVRLQLMEREKEIMLTQQKLIETELLHIQLKDETLRNELELNTKSLTAQTLHVIDKNKMLEGIKQKLQDSLDKDAREQKKNIRNLIKLIEFNFVQDTDWDDFKKNFEKVHEGFFQKLNNKSKDLTPSELRLASLMRMNLSSKDIASTLNISQDSLRISRYRLRKKLALEKGESLQQFILCI